MNLQQLKTFCDLAELGSFSEAARRSSMSQPAVSFQLLRLERELGVSLVDRSHKPIVLTVAGRRLLEFAIAVTRDHRALLGDLDQIREEVTGQLLIGASTVPGEVLLVPILAEFKAVHPAVRPTVDISDSLSVLNGIQAGDFDIGFCGISPDDFGLEHFKIADDRVVLIVFAQHPFASRDAISPTELEGEPLIAREAMSGTQEAVNARLAAVGVHLDHKTIHCILGTQQAVIAAVEAEAGIAFVSDRAIQKSTALGLVKEVPVDGVDIRRNFYCVFHRERLVSRVAREFLSFVESNAAKGGPK